MKTPDKQIFAMLQAFNRQDVLAAIELWKGGLENENQQVKQEMLAAGWLPQKNKPINREFYFVDDEYWVQTEEARESCRQRALEDMKVRKKEKNKTKGKTSSGLKKTKVTCPFCGARTYKQSICPGCNEGKKGFKIRLICEEYPDHEILL